MNKLKDSEEPKVPKYELVVLRDHIYTLYTYNEVGVKIFETRSKVRMKMQLDLLGIDHFDAIHKYHHFILLKYE